MRDSGSHRVLPAGVRLPHIAGVAHTVDLEEVASRLRDEFGEQVPIETILAVVRTSRLDLQGSPPAALPELVERLARQRLLDATSHKTTV